MKVFISATESVEKPVIDNYIANGKTVDYILTSYYYCRKKGLIDKYKIMANEILVDSGAHSFQKGITVDWVEYTKEYAEFIKQNDSPKILGYFEMDVDNVIGYENVLKLRSILESVSNKIIPVWHKNRGIDDFKDMCKQYENRIIAITGFQNEDIKDSQYGMFLKYARKFNCKVHCLGMTRTNMLNKIPFDMVDSSTWKHCCVYGRRIIFKNGKISKEKTNLKAKDLYMYNFEQFIKIQRYYERLHK